MHLDNLSARVFIILGGQVIYMDEKEVIARYLARIGKKGGQSRASKYDGATLRRWARLGGRPRKREGKK